jgi:hypothetical protein
VTPQVPMSAPDGAKPAAQPEKAGAQSAPKK